MEGSKQVEELQVYTRGKVGVAGYKVEKRSPFALQEVTPRLQELCGSGCAIVEYSKDATLLWASTPTLFTVFNAATGAKLGQAECLNIQAIQFSPSSKFVVTWKINLRL